MRKPAKCGTISGYNRHKNNGEGACAKCLKAHAEYASRDDQRAKAQRRRAAKDELARRHPEEFHDILRSVGAA